MHPSTLASDIALVAGGPAEALFWLQSNAYGDGWAANTLCVL